MECWTDPLLHYSPRRLTNKAPVRAERPVDKETAADQVLLRHRPPVAAVITVVAVVAHRKIAVWRNDKGAVRSRQEGLPGRVTPVRRLRRHHPLDAKALRQLAVNIKLRGINPQLIARRARKTLDIERRARFGILANAKNVVGAKNKHVAPVGMDKVVAELVDENLIARVDGAARDDLAAMIGVAGID